MKFLRSKPAKAAVAAVLLLALFLIRPGADRLRNQITGSISLALGRPVDIASVTLRLLPRPGFDLKNFVVHEDPAFGAEPMLRAAEVTASLRLTSLLRGRLEISRLVLTEPSVNLAQDSTGHWNLENLLERADRAQVAPTSKDKGEARPGFPYIEADLGRINFKLGQEKKPYALTNADFSMWQDSENAWGMRLRAQPMRTDFDLSDTGTIRVNGSWQRAASLRDTPVQFSLQWEGAQLGQVTKLASGRDLGWRGAIAASMTLSGTPGDLVITTSDSVDDFRRYDLADGEALRLGMQCNARYSSVDRSLPSLSCRTPIGGGFVRLDGSVGGTPGPRAYDLSLVARNVPMQALVALAKHTKKDIPGDLVATGTLRAAFKFARTGKARQSLVAWTGSGQTQDFAIGSAIAKTELALDKIPFLVSPGTSLQPVPEKPRRGWQSAMPQFASVPHLEIGPFNLGLGRPAPAVVHAWMSRWDYGLQIDGDVQIKKFLQLARTVGVPALQPAADGMAKVDLEIAGPWSAFTATKAVGSAQLEAVHADVRGLNEPLQIASANLILTSDEARLKNMTVSLAGSTWRGSMELPRQCAGMGTCPVHFDLRADTISTDDVSELLSPHPLHRSWYRFGSVVPESRNTYFLALKATGQLRANRVVVHKLAASRVSADVDFQNGVVKIANLRGDVLGGKHVGDWKMDFTGKSPTYTGSGSLQRLVMGQLAEAMQDEWITGTASGTYQVSATGLTAAELTSSATGTLQVEEFAGTLPHIVLAGGTAPLRARSFTGLLLLRDRGFEIQDGKLDSADGIYEVAGTASLMRTLDLSLTRAGMRGFNIGGSLTEPRVAESGPQQTRAALKP